MNWSHHLIEDQRKRQLDKQASSGPSTFVKFLSGSGTSANDLSENIEGGSKTPETLSNPSFSSRASGARKGNNTIKEESDKEDIEVIMAGDGGEEKKGLFT